jgi:hypothetical protein
LTLSNDVNINPGPSTSDSLYPCGICDKPVTWDDRGIVCDTCNQWYHANCQSMKSSLYLEFMYFISLCLMMKSWIRMVRISPVINDAIVVYLHDVRSIRDSDGDK